MQRNPHTSLSDLLRNMADTLRAHAVCDDGITMQGKELEGFIDTLDWAALAAENLEDKAAGNPARPVPPAPGEGGKVVPFAPRHGRHHARARRHSPWRPHLASRPGMIIDDDDTGNGGDAA